MLKRKAALLNNNRVNALPQSFFFKPLPIQAVVLHSKKSEEKEIPSLEKVVEKEILNDVNYDLKKCLNCGKEFNDKRYL